MANYNRITESKFKAVKTLLKGGASVREIMEYLQVSEPVVYGIKKVDTFEEYVNARTAKALEQKQVAAIKAKEKEKEKAATEAKPEPKPEPATEAKLKLPQTVIFQPTHYMMQEMQKTNELLALISNKLSYIVDQLT